MARLIFVCGVLASFFVPSLMGNDLLSIKGTVFTFYDHGELMIAVDESKSGAIDGYIDHIFILQMNDDAARAELDVVEAEGTVGVEENRISVNYNGMDMGLDVYLVGEEVNRAQSSEDKVLTFEGYGLSQYHLNPGTFINMEDLLVLRHRAPKLGSEHACAAGGPGSISSSIGFCLEDPNSCSVSCIAGYYSCSGCVETTKMAICQCIED